MHCLWSQAKQKSSEIILAYYSPEIKVWAQIFPTFPNYLLYLVRIHLASEISEQDFIMGPISWAFGHSTLVACHESVRLISEASLKNDHDLIWGLWKTQTVKLGMLKIVKFSTSGDSVNLMSEVFSPSCNSLDSYDHPKTATTHSVFVAAALHNEDRSFNSRGIHSWIPSGNLP